MLIKSEIFNYWQEYSKKLIEGLRENKSTFKMITIHMIIIQLIDEIEYNNLQSKENKKYLTRMIRKSIDEDIVSKNNFKMELNEICKEINQGNIQTVRYLCERIKEKFDNGIYYNSICNELVKSLQNEELTDKNKEEIKLFGKLLVIELHLYGNCMESIRSIISKFDKLIREKNLEALEYLQSLYTMEEMILIFQIERIRGRCDIQLGDVNIYNPYIKTYINEVYLDKFFKDIEYFENKDYEERLNIAVKMRRPKDYVNYCNDAIDISEKVFRFLEVCLDFSEDMKIVREAKEYYLIDTNGKIVEKYVPIRYSQVENKGCRHLGDDCPNIDIYKVIGNILFGESSNDVEEKIQFSWHWFIKAVKSERNEDKLLFCWIALEKIVELDKEFETELVTTDRYSKADVIKKVLEPLIVLEYPKELLYKINSEIYSLFLVEYSESSIKGKLLKNENEDKFEYLERLLKDIVKMKDEFKYIQSEEIDRFVKFFYEKEYAEKVLKDLTYDVDDDILNIYKLRNKIVHNAFISNNILDYYCSRCVKYTNIALIRIANIYIDKKYRTMEELIANMNFEYQSFNERIKRTNLINMQQYFNL